MNYIKKIAKLILLTVVFANFTSCIINDNIKDTSILIDPGNDPNFKIIVNTDSQFKDFNRKIVVFDIPIFAFKSVIYGKRLQKEMLLFLQAVTMCII